jgi:hypothetical protein
MAGPVPSIDQVPLRDVLPPWLRTAEQDLRRSAHKLDRHPSAVDRIAWHWYPEHTEAASTFDEGNYLLLADTTITLLNTGDDWLELTLDIAWRNRPGSPSTRRSKWRAGARRTTTCIRSVPLSCWWQATTS